MWGREPGEREATSALTICIMVWLQQAPEEPGSVWRPVSPGTTFVVTCRQKEKEELTIR